MATDTKGLHRFMSAVKKCTVENLNNLAVFVSEAVANAGKGKLESKYSQVPTYIVRNNDIPVVTVENYNDERGGSGKSVVAASHDVAFIEFGTGKTGEASPFKGELPTSGVPITGGWEYHYDNPYTKITTKTGRQGWIAPPTSLEGQFRFTTGQPSGNQIFDTATELRQEMTSIAKTETRKMFGEG